MRLVPCASELKSYDGSVVGGDDDCVWDHDAVKSYIGSSYKILVYHNQKEFKQDKYGENRVKKYSDISAAYSISKDPVFTDAFLTKNELIDEVDFFQLEQDNVEFEVFSIETPQNSMYNVWPTKEK